MVSNLLVAALCMGGYVLASSLLVRLWPPRFGKKKITLLKERFPYSVTKIAHRGGCLIGPENTIFTFRRAIVEGKANMLELDVHESRDGQVVVSHDGDLERICGSSQNVRNITVGGRPNHTLPKLLRKIPLHFKSSVKGDHYVASEAVPLDESTRVCLLAEVFEAFPGVPLHIDIKCEGAGFVRQVMKMIEDHKREMITFVGSSNWRNQKHIFEYFKHPTEVKESNFLKEKRNRFRLFAGPVQYGIVQISYYLGILPFIPLNFDVFSIPLFTTTRKRELKNPAERVLAWFLNSPTLWEHLQRRGILVIGWVLNDDDEFEEALSWPINGIMSDDPIALNNFMSSHDASETMNLLPFD